MQIELLNFESPLSNMMASCTLILLLLAANRRDLDASSGARTLFSSLRRFFLLNHHICRRACPSFFAFLYAVFCTFYISLRLWMICWNKQHWGLFSEATSARTSNRQMPLQKNSTKGISRNHACLLPAILVRPNWDFIPLHSHFITHIWLGNLRDGNLGCIKLHWALELRLALFVKWDFNPCIDTQNARFKSRLAVYHTTIRISQTKSNSKV